jgi:hypothetical protein
VAADDDPAVEGEQQVLPHRPDGLEDAAVDSRRDPGRLRARVRRLRLHPLPHEHLEALGRTAEGVTLGHALRVAALRVAAELADPPTEVVNG